jgi:non-heme chloroperoxidase
MPSSGIWNRRTLTMLAGVAWLALVAPTATLSAVRVTPASTAHFGVADIGGGIKLHYAEMGRGVPVIFVHGSISDYGYWKDEVEAFSSHYRAIAYSRRYNYPNVNPPRNGYSAITDADDLAAFIRKLHLGKVFIVGHSYGALTALFLAARHPELVRSMVLAEPPAVSLLRDLPPSEAAAGNAYYADIERHMVAPMKRDFGKDATAAGVADFIDYVYANPAYWTKMSADDKQATLRDAGEWKVMMTTGTLFPVISPQTIRGISTPALLMTGSKTYAFLKPIVRELARLLPHSQTLVVDGAGHQMWFQQPALCRRAAERFFHQTAS